MSLGKPPSDKEEAPGRDQRNLVSKKKEERKNEGEPRPNNKLSPGNSKNLHEERDEDGRR